MCADDIAAGVAGGRMRQLGPPSGGSAHVGDAELGDGVQEVCTGVQDPHILWHSPGEEGQAGGVEQSQHLPRLHHVVQPSTPGVASPLLQWSLAAELACNGANTLLRISPRIILGLFSKGSILSYIWCIYFLLLSAPRQPHPAWAGVIQGHAARLLGTRGTCLLYTSDAADE